MAISAEAWHTARRGILGLLIGLVVVQTAAEGVWNGWHAWLPGSMSRHRDAVAVAITAVAYDGWRGYASYREVNRALREGGLSVNESDLQKIGAKHYFEVMTDPARLDGILQVAATLPAPASAGMYYSQDEKGMAAFFTLAFATLGVSPSSWYWLYFALYALSMVIACLAFRASPGILFFFFCLACGHEILARLLPALPRQDINLVHGNRFLGIMASVAMCHLMFLILKRAPPSAGQIAGAALQTVLICAVANARTAALWTAIAVVLLWAAAWLLWMAPVWRKRPGAAPPASWPLVVLVLGLAALHLHQYILQDPAFRDGRAHGGHVFWHNLVTSLHNNPDRGRYSIPPEFPAYDDQVGYTIFDREIARRGEDRSKYLMQDADWIYRTTSPELDFRWADYDRVLRDTFFTTVTEDPAYAAASFLLHQPRSALTIVLGKSFFRSRDLLCAMPIALLLVLGLALAANDVRTHTRQYLAILAAASLAVLLPVLLAAVAELRVVELFYVLLLDVFVLGALGVSWLARSAFSKMRHDVQA